nr:siphovirus ReqiPepy6 Gp37-like family protein [Pilimelia terevasa]
MEIVGAHNNLSEWSLRLSAQHRLAQELRQPGSGIIVTGPDGVWLSGPTTTPDRAATASDPGGTLTFQGVDDSVILADSLAFPDPSNPDPQTQKRAHDTRTGPAETVMHQFVAANIGPTAPTARRNRFLDNGPDRGRGPKVTKSARFPTLGVLLAEIAAVADLGFRVVQRGGRLVFETKPVTDRTDLIRLDVYNGTLSGHRVTISPPGATRIVVAGQGELTARKFLEVTTPASLAAEVQWQRRIERFVDQRNTNDVDELRQAGLEVLSQEGFTAVAVQAVPMEDSAMPFGIDWGPGDRVAVVVEDQELTAVVTGYRLKIDSEGLRIGALLGDPHGFSLAAALHKRVRALEARLSALERTAEPR